METKFWVSYKNDFIKAFFPKKNADLASIATEKQKSKRDQFSSSEVKLEN